LQREGKFDEAIVAFKNYLSQPMEEDGLNAEQLPQYIEALIQLMNTYQSKGEPEACITALEQVFKESPAIQRHCLRDYYSILGYALSRTEKMEEAEKTILKVFTLPLHQATPERYFRDYAYAAAVFYSNPNYQNEVINWCEEALVQAELCKNTSGKQWVMAMLGTLYKRNGHLNKALQLFQQSKEEAHDKKDELGVLNSLHTLIDLFLYWDIPEYANIYASEAIRVEQSMTTKNPMVSAQTYINKGRVLHQLGEVDSVSFYIEQANQLCQTLPYNSGMVDVNLLNGTFITEKDSDSIQLGIVELQEVTRKGTLVNRAKAYQQLAKTYLKQNKNGLAEVMLDSMYTLLNQNDSPTYIQLDYQPILNHYLKNRNQKKVEQYVNMMLQEQKTFKTKRLNYNFIETIVGLQTEQKKQELKITQLGEANQRLWLLVCITLSAITISAIVAFLFHQKRQHAIQMKQADEKVTSLVQQLNQSNAEKEIRAQEIKDFLKDKENRQELETLTPTILQTDGESKFRQCFELLYPFFLPRLREKVPSITHREEILSMLLVLKQDNKRIAELLSIAPRSVLMLRHRFRQKIGMASEYSLENFIEDIMSSYAELSKE
jgi:tetratricopeptide (TPR) repeat protein/DNA-binding CsgD family transcriptional regulator